MQNPSAASRGPVDRYRERLSPSLWSLVAAALVGPMVALVFVPLDTTIALVAGGVVGILLVALLVWASPVVTVADGTFTAGRAHIDVADVGDPVVRTGEDARRARGPGLDARAWHLLRGGIDGVVIVPIADPDDPVPEWVVSSRTPDRLAAAIRRARVRPRTPRTADRQPSRGRSASGA